MKTKSTGAAISAQHTEEQARVLDLVLGLTGATQATEEENAALRDSLERHGQLVPCLRQGGVLVDGRRRVCALKALGKQPWIVDIDGVSGTASSASAASALGQSFFIANAVRHEMPLLVRAAIADSLATLRKGDNQHERENGLSREEAARSVGVSSDTLDRFRSLKQHPSVFERAMKGEVSLSQAGRLIRAKEQAERAKLLTCEDGDIAASLDRLILAGAKMGLLYVDVPTDYGQASSTAAAAPHTKYPVMSVDALKALRVAQIAAKDSLLWYWTPNSLIPEALEVIAAWGFSYVSAAVWAKPTGVVSKCAVRPYHETLLLAKRGQGLVHHGEQMPSFYQSPAMSRRHSEKPEWFAQQLERLYPEVAKAELFARTARPGWLAIGNQVPKVEQVAKPRTPKAANDGAAQFAGTGEPAPAVPARKRKRAAAAAGTA
jgi:N6-adenosine-specific RNA methylase IME4